MVGGQASNIPLKINTAGVMPVIFASSIMSFPVVISQFFPVDYNTIGGKILTMLNSGSWCRPSQPIYSIGLVIYIVLLFVFAYFYTSITFNPLEVANNMKKQGGYPRYPSWQAHQRLSESYFELYCFHRRRRPYSSCGSSDPGIRPS